MLIEHLKHRENLIIDAENIQMGDSMSKKCSFAWQIELGMLIEHLK